MGKLGTPRDDVERQRGMREELPGVLSAAYSETARGVREDTAELLRPSEFQDVPGSEVLSGMRVPPGEFRELPDQWRAVYACIPRQSVRGFLEVKDVVDSYCGKIIQIPFTSNREIEVVALFPNDAQAKSARSAFLQFSGAVSGVQSSSGLYGGIIHGVPCFTGNGIDDALSLAQGSPQTDTLSELAKLDNDYVGDPHRKTLQSLSQIPRHLSTVCAAMEIRMPGYMQVMDAERRQSMMDAIFGILNKETDVFEWTGSTIKIVSTREQAAAVLCVELKRIIDTFSDANVQIVISEGTLEVAHVGPGGRRPPRVLRSDVFRETADIKPQKGRGMFVSKAEFGRLNMPRGPLIKEALECQSDIFEILEVEYRSTEVETGGPRKMIGRDHLMSEFLRILDSFTRGTPRALVLGGEAGIGKSRFIEECIKMLGKKAKSTYTKVYEHEKNESFSFVRKFAGEVLKKTQDQTSREYTLLRCFVSGGEAPMEVRDEVESLYANPQRLAMLLRVMMIRTKEPLAAFMDDLQWCDDRSVPVIATLLRLIDGNEKILLVFSSRSGTQTMPLLIRQALEERGSTTMPLERLKFVDERGRPTPLLEEYVLESLRRVEPNVKEALPVAFLKKLGETSEGVPFAITQILSDLLHRGVIQFDESKNVVIEGEVNFEDYTARNLYENRIARLRPMEQEVYRILVIFDGSLDTGLFRRLFPELEPYAASLAEQEMIAMGGKVSISHDLLLEAAKGKFPKDPVETWKQYGRMQAIAGNPVYKNAISQTMLYRLVSPALHYLDAIQPEQVKTRVRQAGIEHGRRATAELEEQHRAKEAYEILLELFNKVDVRSMNPVQRYYFRWRLANVAFCLEDRRNLTKSLEAAEKMLDTSSGREVLEGNGMPRLELLLLMCDAEHLKANPGGIEAAILKLEAHCQSMQGLEGLPSRDKLKLDSVQYVAKLGRARASSHGGDFGVARYLCDEVITDLERMEMGMSIALPLEYEKILVEARRFYGIIVGREEEQSRGETDSDVSYSIPMARERKPSLERGILMLKSAIASMQSPKPLMQSPKHLVAALSMLGRLMAFCGHERSKVEKVFDEAVRQASNYQEIGVLSILHKMRGDLYMDSPNAHKSEGILQMAINKYAKGRAEISQIEGGRNHQNYAFNACNEARAIAIKAENFGKKNDQTVTLINEGLTLASDAMRIMESTYGEAAPDYFREVLCQYILPTVGRLLMVSRRLNVHERIVVPENIRGLNNVTVREAITFVAGKQDRTLDQARCVAEELQWKKEGLDALDLMTTPRS